MVNLIYLIIIVLGGTLQWPVNRWAMRHHARPEVLGLCISVVAVAIGAVSVLMTRRNPFVTEVIVFGGIAGIAYSLGFCMVMFYCLKIGPVGPTVTLNNLGLLWPVVISLFFFAEVRLSVIMLFGLLATLLAVVVMAWNRFGNGSITMRSNTTRWFVWALIGWGFSGVGLSCQFLFSHYQPESPFTFMVSMYGVSLILLTTISLIKRNRLFRKEEMLAGSFNGIIMAIIIPLTLLVLTNMPAFLVFTFITAGPVVLMLLIGHFFLNERMNRAGWTASALGVIGIIALAVSK